MYVHGNFDIFQFKKTAERTLQLDLNLLNDFFWLKILRAEFQKFDSELYLNFSKKKKGKRKYNFEVCRGGIWRGTALVDAFGGDEYGTEEAGGSLYTIARVQCVQFCYDRRLVTRYLRGGTLVLIHEYVLFPCRGREEERALAAMEFRNTLVVSWRTTRFLFLFS